MRKPNKHNTGFKNRVILDLKWTRTNEMVVLEERAVLPRGVDHAIDMAALLRARKLIKVLILDFKDAFNHIPLKPEERRFCCADLEERGFVVFYSMGFGGRAFPLVFCRVISLVARLTQSMFDVEEARLQMYVDDPALTAAGAREETDEVFDAAILLWTVLGIPLSSTKGEVSEDEHTWIGIRYKKDGMDVLMEVPPEYAGSVATALGPMAKRTGVISLAQAQQAVGKAGRVAQVVPEARPFAGSLWSALADARRVAASGRREAPPGTVPCVRFAAAAAWFLALLRGAVMPLSRRVTAETDVPLTAGPLVITFDASPWGYGGVKIMHGSPVAWISEGWDEATLRRFKATRGDPAHQTTWEHIAELAVMIVWAPRFSKEAFTVKGDNLGALNNAARLSGKGPLLAISRELAWRRAAWQWKPVYSHLPSEFNKWADDLSRLMAPDKHEVPEGLKQVRREAGPEIERMWEAWLSEPPKTRKPRRGRAGH